MGRTHTLAEGGKISVSRTAVILSGGLGVRLKPFTNIMPKPLLPVGEKAILEIQIEKLKSYGFDNIILATNYKSDYIENFFGDGSKYGVKLTVSKEHKPLGTVGPLTLLRERLTEAFLVMNGDILTELNFSDFYEYAAGDKKDIMTVAIKKIVTPYDFGNIEFHEDYITNIVEKPDIVTYALAGIYAMHPEVLEYIPEDTYYGMDQLILKLLESNIGVKKYEIEEYWLDVGREGDFEKAQIWYGEKTDE